MWECGNCREQIEDRFRHCWNCGKPRPDAPESSAPVRIHLKNEPAPAEEKPLPKDLQAEDAARTVAAETPTVETPPRADSGSEDAPLFASAFPYREKSPSVIGKILPAFLWLAATVAVAAFAYYSNQKTKAFENRLAEDARQLAAQSAQFNFSPNAPREKQGAVKAKILPLDAKTRQLDGLYYALPDDLRPATPAEVNTLLWLDCSLKEVWRYDDGAPGFRESCNAYLVDRNTAKILRVEEFPGEMPAMKKDPGAAPVPGKVAPSAYISFIRANQPENERVPLASAADSPAHHYLFKSELLYALILLGLLGAVAVGWLVYQIKSALWKAA